MVVGDAAGQVDPLTGGGIHIAAECAKIAGETASEAIEEDRTDAEFLKSCLLYTSDAADERSSVDLGGRRIIKKKKNTKTNNKKKNKKQKKQHT